MNFDQFIRSHQEFDVWFDEFKCQCRRVGIYEISRKEVLRPNYPDQIEFLLSAQYNEKSYNVKYLWDLDSHYNAKFFYAEMAFILDKCHKILMNDISEVIKKEISDRYIWNPRG